MGNSYTFIKHLWKTTMKGAAYVKCSFAAHTYKDTAHTCKAYANLWLTCAHLGSIIFAA